VKTHASQHLRGIADYYCSPRPYGDGSKSIYEIWESGAAFNDSITPSAHVPEYRAHIGAVISALTTEGSLIFSLGCGNGFVEGDLARLGRDVRAVDCNEEAVRLARNKMVDAFTADYFSLSPADLAGTDLLYADGLLGHLFDEETELAPALSKLVSLALRPGACLVFSNDAPPDPQAGYARHERVQDFWLISKDYLAASLTSCGFAVRDSYYFPYRRPVSGPRNRTICIASVP
jgi:SAM-dependent methyltransferase